jgi:hypothetical protein
MGSCPKSVISVRRMIMHSPVSSTFVTLWAFNPNCFLINVSISISIHLPFEGVNNSPQRIR